MLYKRQQEILYLISQLNGIGKVKLQKLMFLANYKQDEVSYDFVPYKYGPYSFILQKDLDYLVSNNFLIFKHNKYRAINPNYINITPKRRDILNSIISRYSMFSTKKLMQYVYREYPRFAIKSCKANSILSAVEISEIKTQIPDTTNPSIFTIGYEGKSIDKYLSYLVFSGIKVLIDVRANAISMKPEFSERNLGNFCNLMDIKYIHIPELGISSEQRKAIKDKKILFKDFRMNLTSNGSYYLNKIRELAITYKRIALPVLKLILKNAIGALLPKSFMMNYPKRINWRIYEEKNTHCSKNLSQSFSKV